MAWRTTFLTTLYLAFTGRVVIAPAMNTNMWNHPATQKNIETLRSRGNTIVEPGDGLLACGTTGPGRLPEPEQIADVVVNVRRDLEGETVIVTAGPTQEPLDPVRYIRIAPVERWATRSPKPLRRAAPK